MAKSVVIQTLNLAKERLGVRQALCELADAGAYAWKGRRRLNLSTIETPIPITGEKFIAKAIETEWALTDVFKYNLNYLVNTSDEASQYYYFEAMFSQPTPACPIPQATGSVFFRIEDKRTDNIKAPMVWFRIEGEETDHDARYVAPCADWILALIQKKLKFFRRIESFRMF